MPRAVELLAMIEAEASVREAWLALEKGPPLGPSLPDGLFQKPTEFYGMRRG